jgi:polygalacturonase
LYASSSMNTGRRDLLKLSPFAVAAATSIGRTAFADAPAPTTGEAIFNVRNFGTTGDGKSVDTPAINRAIEAVVAAGGGTLVFPAGTYLCFTIRLRSNVDLYLSRGCVILAADSPKPGEATGYNGGMYDPAGPPQLWEQYQDYGHNHWNNSLFYGEGLSNFSMIGPGLIHGRGLSYGQGARAGAKADRLRGPGAQFQAEQVGGATRLSR